MLELLRDGLWQSIGVVVAIVAIIVTIIIYKRQTQRKALTWIVKSYYPLLTGSEELQGRLQVQVDGLEVNNIDLLFIEFSNSGNVPIERGDFDSPVMVEFESPARVISAVVDSEEPNGIGASLSTQESSATFNPVLLNPSDKVTLKFILSSDTKKFGISGRIVGIKEIQEAKSSNFYVWLGLAGLLILSFGLAFAIYYAPIRPEPPTRSLESRIALTFVTLGYFIAIYAIIRGNFIRKVSQTLSQNLKKIPD